MYIDFKKDFDIGPTVLKWWEGLVENRADRATLRRAPGITTVALTPAYQRFYQRLAAKGWESKARPYQNDNLAAAIGLLSHVKINSEQPPAKAMSPENDSDRPRVSELRFVRLLESPDLDALFTGLRRVIPLMNHSVDVLALATDIVNWGDAVKKRWAYDYKWSEKAKN